MIHKPGPGDYADRLTVLLLKLEHVMKPGAAADPRVEPWLRELEVCIRNIPPVPAVVAQLYYSNRQIWEGEDEIGRLAMDTVRKDARIADVALRIRRLNRERAMLVGRLNDFNDKVTS